MRRRLVFRLALGLFLPSACSAGEAPALIPTYASVPVSYAGLHVEEYALTGAPAIEPLSFTPVGSTMQQVLALRAAERSNVIPDDSVLLIGHHAIRRALGSDELIASESGGGPNAANSVTVTRNGTQVYAVPAGMPSPIAGLQGFWIFQDRYWALETTYVAPETIAGLIAVDGRQLVPGNGFDEGFGLQILADQPFYFARQGSKIGYFFGGQFTDAGYSEIPHYQCCSAASLNPVHAANMIAFFARRGTAWYYVEISVIQGQPE